MSADVLSVAEIAAIEVRPNAHDSWCATILDKAPDCDCIYGLLRRIIASSAELRDLMREAVETIHQTGSIRDHADPNDTTGWNVHGVETCEDPLCRDLLAAIGSRLESRSA